MVDKKELVAYSPYPWQPEVVDMKDDGIHVEEYKNHTDKQGGNQLKKK